MGILALIAEFENDIRRERQMDGIVKAKERGVKFGRKRELTPKKVAEIQSLRKEGTTVPEIMRRTKFSKASVYRRARFGAPPSQIDCSEEFPMRYDCNGDRVARGIHLQHSVEALVLRT